MKSLLGWREDGAKDTAKMLRLLERFGHGFRVIARDVNGCTVIRGGFEQHYRWFSLCDNGGEINVEAINRPETMVSVATDSVNRPRPTLETIALRLSDALLGRPIDYENVEEAGSLDCLLSLSPV